jgi:SAM-dependent methyltransferase
MDERGTGLWAPLRLPSVYEAFQRAIGSPHVRHVLVDEYLRLQHGDRVLDIGCGPGAMRSEMGDVSYTGFDPSAAYISAARDLYGDAGTFFVGSIGDVSEKDLGTYDVVLAKSVLHHVDDEVASELFRLSSRVLEPTGKLVTSDCCYVSGQSGIARFVISRDRGRHVRSPEAYEKLARTSFGKVTVDVRHDLLRVPYTHAIMVCVDHDG